MGLWMLLQQSGAKLSPGRVASGWLYISAIAAGLIALVALVVWVAVLNFARARRRKAEQMDKDAEPRVERPRKDPWIEAGKRAGTPSAADLERGITRAASGGGSAARSTEPLESGEEDGPTGRPVALVTGAARRVGRAIAKKLAAAGCDVYFTYHQSSEEAEGLARELSELGSTGSFHQVDLGDAAQVEALGRDLAGTLEKLDVLVHNASIYAASPLSELSLEEVLKQYQINAAAPLVLTARLAPLLMQSDMKGGGAVVAFTDIHAMGRPRREFSAYAMSKAAVTEMVYSLARDLAPLVRVNGVAPGVVAWPEEGEEKDPDAQRKYVRRIPLARPGTPEDAAEVVRWLALDATYLTGEIIRVDGGRWLT
jgi:pteridine reductase